MRVIAASYAASPQYQPPPTYNPEIGPVATPTQLRTLDIHHNSGATKADLGELSAACPQLEVQG